MSLIEALILGFIQGITEYLPISSTAHIVIASYLLDISFDGLTFEIFLHLASALAVIIYFRKDLVKVIVGFFTYFKHKTDDNRVQFRFGTYIILATLLTGVLGVLFQSFVNDSIKTPPVIAGSLIVTALFLIFIDRFHKVGNKDESTMTLLDTFIVGIGQTLAVLPGISRSGATIVTSLLTGLNRETAVRFSFLLAIPAILGSTLLELRNFSVHLVHEAGVGPLVVSFIATFLFSIIGIMWLIDFLKRSKLIYFAFYCFALALFVLFYFESSTIIDLQ